MTNEDPNCANCGAPKSQHIGGRGRSVVSADCVEFTEAANDTDDPEVSDARAMVLGATAETLIPMAAGLVRRLLDRKLPASPDLALQAANDELRATNERLSNDLTQAKTDRDNARTDRDEALTELSELRAARTEPGEVASAIDGLTAAVRQQNDIAGQILAAVKAIAPPKTDG